MTIKHLSEKRGSMNKNCVRLDWFQADNINFRPISDIKLNSIQPLRISKFPGATVNYGIF